MPITVVDKVVQELDVAEKEAVSLAKRMGMIEALLRDLPREDVEAPEVWDRMQKLLRDDWITKAMGSLSGISIGLMLFRHAVKKFPADELKHV